MIALRPLDDLGGSHAFPVSVDDSYWELVKNKLEAEARGESSSEAQKQFLKRAGDIKIMNQNMKPIDRSRAFGRNYDDDEEVQPL